MSDQRKVRARTCALVGSSIVASVLLSFGAFPVLAGEHPQASLRQTGSTPSHLLTVGMVALLANPERYDGAHVRAFGFLHIGRDEDMALYLHREDYNYQLTKNSFYVALSPEQRNQFHNLNDQYVLLEGVVRSSKAFQADASGTMVSITRVELWNPLHIGSKRPIGGANSVPSHEKRLAHTSCVNGSYRC